MQHLKPALLAWVAQAPALAGAFVAPPPRFSGAESAAVAAATAPKAKQAMGAATPPAASVFGNASLFAGAVVTGAVAAVLGRQKRASRNDDLAGCQMRGIREDLPEWMQTENGTKPLPPYWDWIRLKKKSRFANGRRQRFFKQQLQLKEAGVWSGYKQWHEWHPNRENHNLYKGPDSHPDNPWFPAASGGWPTKALSAASPAPLMASTPQKSSGLFTGSAVPTLGLAKKRGIVGGVRAKRQGLVLKAHKKAASSTKNQGHNKNAHHYGITKTGRQGCAVKKGALLVKQCGQRWKAGANVSRGRDYSLNALKDGIVQWRGTRDHKEVYVVPWEYVNEKCVWISGNTLAPKKYEPWMGKPHSSHKTYQEQKQRPLIRRYIAKIREEFLESEEGKEWAAKKKEKKKKQREIQARIREHRWKRRQEQKGATPSSAKEEVAASSAGESESEPES